MTELNELLQRIKKFRDERDWLKFHNHKDMALSMVLEATEVLEHFQWKNKEEVEEYGHTHKNEIGEELADVFIYLLELANNLGIDLIDASHKKLDQNNKNYPVEKAKSSAKKYTEL
ncbi:nucleotide pyrophosphohydrolase [Patescibacteria group bacterium]|nr:nucleotide pyrophosphohydrolase [Patescibacteria group bacterium]